MIDEEACEKIDAAGVKNINVYSVITCSLPDGVCSTCYGRDLSRGILVNVGEAIGMIFSSIYWRARNTVNYENIPRWWYSIN